MGDEEWWQWMLVCFGLFVGLGLNWKSVIYTHGLGLRGLWLGLGLGQGGLRHNTAWGAVMAQWIWQYHQLRARRVLTLFNDVSLRTRRALSPQTLYSDSALLVLNGTSLNSINILLALNWRYSHNWEVPGSILLATTAVSLGKAFNPHCLVPWRGLLFPWLLPH